MSKSDIIKSVVAGSFVIGSLIITNIVIKEYDKVCKENDKLNDTLDTVLGKKIKSLSKNNVKKPNVPKLIKTEIVDNNKIRYYENGMSLIQFNVEKGA